MSAPPPFEHVAQDGNAFNPGDCVKVVIDDAARPFLDRGRPAWLLDSHAGAGCYPVVSQLPRPVVADDDYFAVMERDAVPALAQAGLMVRPAPPNKSRAKVPPVAQVASPPPVVPRFVGVAPMLLHRHRALVRYEGFETNRKARERLLATFRALGQHGSAQADDGWTGCLAALRASGDVDVVAFFDPMNFNSPEDRDGLRAVLAEVKLRRASTLLAVFVPGTFSQRTRSWLAWKPVEDELRSWADAMHWASEGFHVRDLRACVFRPS